MKLFSLRFTKQGRHHTHVVLFAGIRKCGDLIFRNDEWANFHERLVFGNEASSKIQVINEELS